MNDTPLISVIIPTARRPVLVRRAVDSVLDQTIGDLEVIVVVDGDDPATIEALDRVTDPRLRVIVNPSNLGACGSRNRGAIEACGFWVAFLDDDDEWLPEKLECQLAAANGGGKQPAIVACRNRVITPAGEFVWPKRLYDSAIPVDEYLFDRRSFFKGDGFIQTSCLMMPADLFRELHFSVIQQHEDWDLLIRAVNGGYARLLMLPEVLVVHYAENDSSSLSATFNWRKSLQWCSSLGPLVSARANSGFALTVVAPVPANAGEYGAFLPLFTHAWRNGAPNLYQLAVFFAFWIVPVGLRRRVRWLHQRVCNALAREPHAPAHADAPHA